MAVEPRLMPQGLLLPSTLRKPEPPKASPMGDAIVTVEGANDNNVHIDPATGVMTIEDDDGGVTIDFNPLGNSSSRPKATGFNANLAEYIDASELGRIADEQLQGIQVDEQSRREWLEIRGHGIRLLGLKIEQPRSSVDATSSVEGMSSIHHPALLEGTLRFQANARGELLPAGGPVKVVDKLTQTGRLDEISEKLEDDLNFYLTEVATEYYPDTDRMLLYVGFSGCGFKKVYNCPLRLRPVSESVDAKDLIVSNAATDMANSGRVTHQIAMRQSVLKRMQLAGAYRNTPLVTPTGVIPSAVDRQVADTQGVVINQSPLTQDREHTIYEVYCELDIRGYEHMRDGEATGLPLPYRVVIDKDSREVLEIRRNWREDDETLAAKICFVKYPYVPGLGFYDIGLIHILGNTTVALTAAWREMLDAGMFANFPGFLYRKSYGRQNTNEFRVPPGGGMPIETDGAPITDVVMNLPYKDISPAFSQFIEQIAETAQRVGGTAEVQIAEGRQDAPVGTTLAMIEQATKIEGAVHKRLHAAQAAEFQLLRECFRENPGSFVRAMKARGDTDWDEDSFMQALNDASISPVADPDTPSHMHRLMKAMALIQLDKAYPHVMDPVKLLKRVAIMIKVDDFDSLLAAPQQQSIPPEALLEMAKLKDKAADRESKVQMQQLKDASDTRQFQHDNQMQSRESADQAADRRSREYTASLSFRESMMNNRQQVMSDSVKMRTAAIDALSDHRQASADIRVAEEETKQAEHGVKAAQAGSKTAEHKAKGDEAKAKAAAKKPAAKKK